MDINELAEQKLEELYNLVDTYLVEEDISEYKYIAMSAARFKYLRRLVYYNSLLTVEVLVKVTNYIIYTTKHLRDKYKRTNYRAKLIKELKQL